MRERYRLPEDKTLIPRLVGQTLDDSVKQILIDLERGVVFITSDKEAKEGDKDFNYNPSFIASSLPTTEATGVVDAVMFLLSRNLYPIQWAAGSVAKVAEQTAPYFLRGENMESFLYGIPLEECTEYPEDTLVLFGARSIKDDLVDAIRVVCVHLKR